MKNFLTFMFLVVLPGCSSMPLALMHQFRHDRDFESLNRLVSHIRIGMPRAEIEKLLGQPDYCPTDGLCYYSTADQKAEDGIPLGLIVDYRCRTDKFELINTGELKSFSLGPIKE